MTPEQKQLVADLKQDLGRIGQEVEQAVKEDAAYDGGLVKALVRVRLEILKTNAALVEQRVHALEAGSPITMIVSVTEPDATRAAELAREMQGLKAKVAEARAEADRYAGGLAQAVAETALATVRNTLAMIEQQYFIAHYGLAMPYAPLSSDASTMVESNVESACSSNPTVRTAGASSQPKGIDCLKIEALDSSVLSMNDAFTELAWKVDVSNSCDQPFALRVVFTVYDKDEFELDSDSQEICVPPMGTGKARGKMLVSPPEKARRMALQRASLQLC